MPRERTLDRLQFARFKTEVMTVKGLRRSILVAKCEEAIRTVFFQYLGHFCVVYLIVDVLDLTVTCIVRIFHYIKVQLHC